MRQDAMRCKDQRNEYAFLSLDVNGRTSSGGEVATVHVDMEYYSREPQ